MREKEVAPDGVWQYKARWRSTMGTLTLVMLSFAGFSLLAAAIAPGRTWIVPGLGALFFGGLAWLVGKPLFTRAWIVRIGPRGISGHLLNNRTVPWRDVRDLGVETVQGNTFLVLDIAQEATESLQKTRRWLTGKKTQRRIVLNSLRKPEIAEAIAAAQATFAERAAPHAAAAVEARQEEARFEAAFAETLEQKTGTTWALYLVVALNVGVWLLNVVNGLSPGSPASPDLFRWGANSAWAVTREHEYWRLLTGTFLHGGLVHLAMNMLGLWGAGKLLNRLYGNEQFLLVYFAAALAGSAASLHFGAQTAVSVGASGAVFGVLGALLVAVRRNRELLPKALMKQIVTSEGVFLVYALLNGFVRPGIDNAAHVGGLVAGAVMAWVLATVVDRSRSGARAKRAVAAAAGVLVAVGALVAATPSPKVDHRALFAATERIQQAIPKLQAAQAALQKDAQAAQAGRMTEPQLVQQVESVHLPALQQVHAELTAVRLGQGDPRADMVGDMRLITAKTVQLLELQVRQSRGQGEPGDPGRMETIGREVKDITRRLQERAAALAKKTG